MHALYQEWNYPLRMNEKGLHSEPEIKAAERFYSCAACGQLVDRLDLDETVHHQTDGHEPIPVQ